MTEHLPPPGPERDALVATMIMGWREQTERWRWVDRPPHWSTDDHAALDLLMEMRQQGWWAEVVIAARYGVSFTRHHEVLIRGGETTNTFADAVSAAALRASWAER